MLGQLIQKLNTESSLTQDLEELSLEGFASLEYILTDLKDVMLDVKAEIEVMSHIAAETFEIQREALVMQGLARPQDGEAPSPETEDSETEKSMLDALKNISDKVGLTGLAMGLFAGLVGLAKIALPLLFTALGVYIARRWENFDLENELDRMAFTGITGAGIGALIGGFLLGPAGVLLGGLLGGIGGLLLGYAIKDEDIKAAKQYIDEFISDISSFVDDVMRFLKNPLIGAKEALGLISAEEAEAQRQRADLEDRMSASEKEGRFAVAERDVADRKAQTFMSLAESAPTEEKKKFYLDKAAEQIQIRNAAENKIKASAQKTQSLAGSIATNEASIREEMDKVNSMSFYMDDGDTGDVLTPPVSALQRLQNEARTDSAAGQPAISMQQVDASSSSVSVKNETVGVKGQGALRSVGRGAEKRRAAVN